MRVSPLAWNRRYALGSCRKLTPSPQRIVHLLVLSRAYHPATGRSARSMSTKTTHDDRSDVKRLILCFDGTGNAFQGNTSDTNIVKLLDMFDRSDPRQMHYYQPGIGTYTSGGSVNLSLIGRINKSITQTIDSGLATSFDAHVIAGYRFLMRYYQTNDRVYLFGFSRGAFTARFLARMISHVGLLSMGNEEMVPFAYKVYQDYEMSLPNHDDAQEYMKVFRSSFCRHGLDYGVKVHFLGLFDTVNSVGTFDIPYTKTKKAPDVLGTAEHVRHAVAIDERRVKFKAALLAQDKLSIQSTPEDIKEVWFPGQHGDIGGGWPAEPDEIAENLSWWERFKRALFTTKNTTPAHSNKDDDRFQLSDIPLKWMIDELTKVEGDDLDRVRWNDNRTSFSSRFDKDQHKNQSIEARMHDILAFGGGCSFGSVLLWKLMEYLPFIKRWEYFSNKGWNHEEGWNYVTLPLNKGGTRDIPPGALFHRSVIDRLLWKPKKSQAYRPRNDINHVHKDSENGRYPHSKTFHLADAILPEATVNGNTPHSSEEAGRPYFTLAKEGSRSEVGAPHPKTSKRDLIYSLQFD